MPECVNIAVAPVLSFHAMSSSSQTDKGVYRSTSIKLSDRSYELLLLLLLFVYQPVRQCLYGGSDAPQQTWFFALPRSWQPGQHLFTSTVAHSRQLSLYTVHWLYNVISTSAYKLHRSLFACSLYMYKSAHTPWPLHLPMWAPNSANDFSYDTVSVTLFSVNSCCCCCLLGSM